MAPSVAGNPETCGASDPTHELTCEQAGNPEDPTMEANRAIVTYVALAIPFLGMAVGTLISYLVGKQAREERAMLNRERLAAIEKGLDVPLFDLKEPRLRRSPLSSALQTLAIGVGLCVPVLGYGPGAWMWGFLLALLGLAMLTHWLLGGKQEWERERELDEALRRAYIDRLQAGPRSVAPEPHDGH